MAMLLMQLMVLALICTVHNCWGREYECLEAERELTAKKKYKRNSRQMQLKLLRLKARSLMRR
ncbi:hypothetical protein CRYUN_Cryun02cG0024800 [Craigia yunnanensis]